MSWLSGASVFAKGLCMGAADVVPGVSGGTMALILGIYQRLVDAIRHVDLPAIRLVLRGRVSEAARRMDVVFLLILGAGIVCAIVFFTRVVSLPELIRTRPELIYGLFFGLIVASIGVLLHERVALGLRALPWLVVGLLVGLAVVTLVPLETPTASWFIFLCGAIAICAMILPGISGSFILLMLQKYAYVFDAVGRFDFTVIVPFVLGCAVGLAAFSRFLGWLLARFHEATLLTIIGILTASLWTIWPFQERTFAMVRGKERILSSTPVLPAQWDDTVLASLLLAIAGMVTVTVLAAVARRRGSGSGQARDGN